MDGSAGEAGGGLASPASPDTARYVLESRGGFRYPPSLHMGGGYRGDGRIHMGRGSFAQEGEGGEGDEGGDALKPKAFMKKVLVLYTGGTIGMMRSPRGYIPQPDYMEALIRRRPQLHDAEYEPPAAEVARDGGCSMLYTPPSAFGNRITYSILEFNPLLDSCNMSAKDWAMIATGAVRGVCC